MIVASVVTYSTYCGVSLDGRARINDWLHKFYARESFRKTWGEAPTHV